MNDSNANYIPSLKKNRSFGDQFVSNWPSPLGNVEKEFELLKRVPSRQGSDIPQFQ